VIMKDPEFEPVPAELRKLLKRCLEKDPKKRLRDITGVDLLLEAPEPVGQAILSPAKRSMFGPAIAYSAAALFALALAALAFIHFRETPPPAEVVRFQIPAPEKSSFSGNVWVSPDGRRIAFAAPDATGRALIWIRTLDSLQL